MESILETKAATIPEFLAGLRGTLSVTFEEGTWAAWLYDLLRPHVANLVVCNPRKNALLKHGNKSDKIDARKLADLLRLNDLEPVYHGETGVRMLRELARSYLTIVKDVSRVMNRLKAIYRSWAIPCAGRDVYYTRHRREWLGKIPEAGTRRRAEQLYQQLDMLQHLRQQARRELLAESCKHTITAKLRQIPSLGPIRATSAPPTKARCRPSIPPQTQQRLCLMAIAILRESTMRKSGSPTPYALGSPLSNHWKNQASSTSPTTHFRIRTRRPSQTDAAPAGRPRA
ncbi:MAG: transposase [Candidatus Sulfotelmatobacter sp.]